MRSLRAQRPLPARGRTAAGAAGQRPISTRRCAHARGGLIIVATPMAGARRRCCAALPADAPRRAVAVQGLPGRHRLARPRGRARGVLPDARGRRAVGPELRDRGGARPADGAGRREPAMPRCASRRSARCTRRRCASTPPSDPVGVEVGGAVKNVLAIATGIADGMQLGLNARAALVTRGLAEMTRLGVALGARAGNLHGPVGPGRPGADDHRRPVAQPHGRPAAWPKALPLAAILSRAGPCRRGRRAARRWCCAARACARRRDADRRSGRAGARRPAGTGAERSSC